MTEQDIYRLARHRLPNRFRHLAEDVTQNALLDIWRTEAKSKRFICQIVKCQVANAVRRERRHAQVGVLPDVPVETPLRDDTGERVERLLARLNPDERETVRLVLQSGLQGAAARLGLRYTTLYGRWQRCLARLGG